MQRVQCIRQIRIRGGLLVRRSGGDAELREEDVLPTEPARDLREIRGQRRVRGRTRPGRIERVSVHAQEIADLSRLRGTETAILLKVFHMQTDRDGDGRVRRADRVRDRGEPRTREIPRRRHANIRVLVTQIPRPERGMVPKGRGGLARQSRLRVANGGVLIPVAR
jgi:hypothetical protein